LILTGVFSVVLTLIVVGVVYLENRPDLSVWHLADLDEEFTAGSDVSSFAEYLALEDRLFRQLDELVYDQIEPEEQTNINRFNRGSAADPERWSPNWNRSYEMPVEAPRAGVLLLHGMSDSPYSLRNMADRLHESGAYVLGLRIPGHGTAPSGLVEVTWQDMDAAVRIAMRHLEARSDGQPLYIVGYSNGAALAVNYTLETLDDAAMPRISRLALISPEIGIARVGALAVWQARLGHLLGLEKLAWNDIALEYDPFKYGSFAVNAGDVVWRLTNEIQTRITRLTERREISGFPPTLAFSSVIDATVLAPKLIENLYNRLPAGGHELVLFDINRVAGIEPLMKWRPDQILKAFREDTDRTYTFRLVTNENEFSENVVSRTVLPGESGFTEQPIDLEWHEDLYSLSHIALPFPPGDPLYGGEPSAPSPGISLGNIVMKGERGALYVSPAQMLRIRWNPFYPFLEDTVVSFLELDADR